MHAQIKLVGRRQGRTAGEIPIREVAPHEKEIVYRTAGVDCGSAHRVRVLLGAPARAIKLWWTMSSKFEQGKQSGRSAAGEMEDVAGERRKLPRPEFRSRQKLEIGHRWQHVAAEWNRLLVLDQLQVPETVNGLPTKGSRIFLTAGAERNGEIYINGQWNTASRISRRGSPDDQRRSRRRIRDCCQSE